MALPHSHRLILLATATLALTTLPLLAAKVTVTPKGREFHAGTTFQGAGLESKAGSPFQFHAQLEGFDSHEVRWLWSVVDLDGKTALADAGRISEDGVYTPPAVSLSKYRLIKIKATALAPHQPSGTVMVTLRPHLALTPLERVLGQQWRGERVELLADLTPQENQEDATERKADAGGDSDSGSDSSGAENDSDEEYDLGSKDPFTMAFASRVPWAEPDARQDQWIVAAHKQILLVSAQGKVRPVVVGATARRRVGGRDQRYRPFFRMVAVKPWRSAADGAWACYLWDALGCRLWRLDAEGKLSEFLDLTGKVQVCVGLAVDTRGNVYFNGFGKAQQGAGAAGDDSDEEDSSEVQAIYRIAPDHTITLLAGGPRSKRPVDGVGPKAGFSGANGMALAEDRGCAYVLDGEEDEQTWVRTIRLADGAVTSQPLDHRRFKEEDDAYFWPAYHKGALLVSRAKPAAFYVADPATGHCEQVYWDGLSPKRYGPFRTAEGAPQPSGDVVPGPAFHKTRGVARAQCGTLGMYFRGLFSIGDDGQIVAMGKHKLGLVLLDWADPRSPLARAASAGKGSRAGREERKAPAVPGAGDIQAGSPSKPGAGGSAQVSPSAQGRPAGLPDAAGGAGRLERKDTGASKAEDGHGGSPSRTAAGSPAPAPRIERFRPAAGGPGTLVVVYGQNLDRVDQVYLGSLRIQTFVAGPTGTSLSFILPRDIPASAPAPIILSCPAATGARRLRTTSRDYFTVQPSAPIAKP